MTRKNWLALSVALTTLFVAQGAYGQDASAPATPAAKPAPVDDKNTIVITAQRRSENLQDVPIAVSAFTNQNLKDQRIESGAQLIQAVPNMTFQPGLFAKPDFVIRGIGYQLVTSTGEAGVATHENDAPLTISRIAQADFFDINRVEVLRGPQGTLYGRNATGGVINVITQDPTSLLSSSFTGEAGDYKTYKAQGYVNLPMGDKLALRVAGDYSTFDGYQINQFNGHHVNGTDRWAGRGTLAFKPNDGFSAYLTYQHFDQSGGNGNGGNIRDVCLHDPGPGVVGGVTVTNPIIQAFESTGCAPASIYNPAVMTGVVNGVGNFGNRLVLGSLASGDLLATNTRNADPYSVFNNLDPYGKSKNDLYQVRFQQKLSDSITLFALGTYTNDNVKSGAGGLYANIPFNFGVTANDPQLALGDIAHWASGGFNSLQTKEGSVELRLQSSFAGPWNFSVGANHVNLDRRDDVFVYDNINYIVGTGTLFLPVDPRGPADADGAHYYFQSVNPYKLDSTAVFGELIFSPTDKLKITGGLRYTDDKKTFYANTSAGNLLSGAGGTSYGNGYLFDDPPQFIEFREPTGRINIDYKITPTSSLYVTASRGYKGGGFNPPNAVTENASYKPEFVNAFEIGSKNQFFDRSLTLNATGFYYDYKGYQFTRADSLGTKTDNLDARIWGAELETIWRPVDNLALNAQVGYLNTKILNGSSADPYNPTGGDPNLSFMRSLFGGCVVNTANFAQLISDIQSGVNSHGGSVHTASELANLGLAPSGSLSSGCADLDANGVADNFAEYNLFATTDGFVLGDTSLGPLTTLPGVQIPLAGKKLPNDPAFTVAVGAQYTFNLGPAWTLTPRVDSHYQASTFGDVFNDPNYKVKAYHTENASLTLANTSSGINIQAYVKNIADKHDLVGAAPGGGAITGDGVSIIVQDPRTIGVSLTKKF